MVVLNNKCKKCNYICNTIYFQQNFECWTSGNYYIDKFIQTTQLSAHDNYKAFEDTLEWIPYNRFNDVRLLRNTTTGRKVYKANWIDGNISYWNNENQNWKRNNQNKLVVLENLGDPKNITQDFMNEV
jgi:hypothetical protein